MIHIGIDPDGQIIPVAQQYVRIRTGQSISLHFFVASSVDEADTWDLSAAELSFSAKQYINDTDDVLSFNNASSRWSRTNASSGSVSLSLSPEDTRFADVSMFGQLSFTIGDMTYKSELINLSFEKGI